MSDQILKLISEAKETRASLLDLSNSQLATLPNELLDLPWLERLILHDNTNLRDITILARFSNLKLIDLSRTIVRDIGILSALKQLQHVDLSYTLVEDLSPLKDLAKLHFLDASFSLIQNLSSLSNLTDLKILHVSDTPIKADSNPLEALRTIKGLLSLDISKTNITDLEPLRDHILLEELNVYSTPIFDLEPLRSMEELKSLDISYTKISDLAALENLTQLQSFKAYSCPLKDLSPLKRAFESSLSILDVSKTGIESLLVLDGEKKYKLDSLDASNTAIKDFGFLNTIPDLSSLNLSSTALNDLSSLGGLTKLRTLNVSSTEVSDLSALQNLSRLEYLNISNTKVSNLSPLSTLQLSDINISNCPIPNPPNLGNKMAVMRYFKELENKVSVDNNQTKLIFVGNSRAGKTSLWRFLKDATFEKEASSTHGIKIEIWDSEKLDIQKQEALSVHIWDFGGQEYYHATHRLFLSENAVYVLVWEKDTNMAGSRVERFALDDEPNSKVQDVEVEHFPVSYWMDVIRHYGGKCQSLIVQNKVDTDQEYSELSDWEEESQDSFHLSVQNAFRYKEGDINLEEFYVAFQTFKLRLLKALRRNASGFTLLKYWIQVREKLEELAKGNEFIPIQNLREIALEYDDKPDLENLLYYLKNFTNTILYFPQNEILKDRIYLNPAHISHDIYKILNTDIRESKYGRFDLLHVQNRLDCDIKEAERYVALMEEFDLIFAKTESNEDGQQGVIVAPQYLKLKEELKGADRFIVNNMHFEKGFFLQFRSFVPRSLMLRFIANNGVHADQEHFWRNGIIYKNEKTNALLKVEFEPETGIFSVEVQDRSIQLSDLQQVVSQFAALDGSEGNLKISNDGRSFIELSAIRQALERNMKGNILQGNTTFLIEDFAWLSNTSTSMISNSLKDYLKSLVLNANEKAALAALYDWTKQHDERLNNEAIQLSARLTRLEQEINRSTIDSREAKVFMAQITNSLNALIDELPNAAEAPVGVKTQQTGTVDEAPKPENGIVKILMLTANPSGTTKLNLDREQARIAEKIQDKRDQFSLIVQRAVDNVEFKEFTEKTKPRILHFSGHGEEGEHGGIIVQNEDKNGSVMISPESLDVLFEYFVGEGVNMDAVVLNACYSEDQALAISKHVPYVVCTTAAIEDTYAIAFSVGFYFKLTGTNIDIEQAYKSGRAQAVVSGANKAHFILYKNNKKLEI